MAKRKLTSVYKSNLKKDESEIPVSSYHIKNTSKGDPGYKRISGQFIRKFITLVEKEWIYETSSNCYFINLNEKEKKNYIYNAPLNKAIQFAYPDHKFKEIKNKLEYKQKEGRFFVKDLTVLLALWNKLSAVINPELLIEITTIKLANKKVDLSKQKKLIVTNRVDFRKNIAKNKKIYIGEIKLLDGLLASQWYREDGNDYYYALIDVIEKKINLKFKVSLLVRAINKIAEAVTNNTNVSRENPKITIKKVNNSIRIFNSKEQLIALRENFLSIPEISLKGKKFDHSIVCREEKNTSIKETPKHISFLHELIDRAQFIEDPKTGICQITLKDDADKIRGMTNYLKLKLASISTEINYYDCDYSVNIYKVKAIPSLDDVINDEALYPPALFIKASGKMCFFGLYKESIIWDEISNPTKEAIFNEVNNMSSIILNNTNKQSSFAQYIKKNKLYYLERIFVTKKNAIIIDSVSYFNQIIKQLLSTDEVSINKITKKIIKLNEQIPQYLNLIVCLNTCYQNIKNDLSNNKFFLVHFKNKEVAVKNFKILGVALRANNHLCDFINITQKVGQEKNQTIIYNPQLLPCLEKNLKSILSKRRSLLVNKILNNCMSKDRVTDDSNTFFSNSPTVQRDIDLEKNFFIDIENEIEKITFEDCDNLPMPQLITKNKN